MMLSGISQVLKVKHCMVLLYVEAKKVNLVEGESRIVVCRDWIG
jgi:hypothetical protein